MREVPDEPSYDDRQDFAMRSHVSAVHCAYDNMTLTRDQAVRALFDADVPAAVVSRVMNDGFK